MRRILLTQLHAATVFLGVVCATLGAVAIYLNKEKAGKPHFTSPHSQVGIGFVLLVLSSYASAFFNVATNGPAAVSSAKRGDGLAVTATSLSSSSPPPNYTHSCAAEFQLELKAPQEPRQGVPRRLGCADCIGPCAALVD